MKREVGTEGIIVNRINRTKGGNVQIRINGKEEKDRQMFKESLAEKLVNTAAVETKRKGQTVMILDIDETIVEEEVQSVLNKELSDCPGGQQAMIQLKLTEKTNRNGIKYAFATLQAETAKHLVEKKMVGEGWHRWRIKEIITPPKCYKCHRVGHAAGKCGAKEDAYYRCGDVGHKKRDCQKEQFCYLCKEEGHKAETMHCPEYRKLVLLQRREEMARPKSNNV